MKKNILITGAAGFLGSHLTLHHLKQGDNVLGLDNFSSSHEKSPHLRLIQELYGPEKFKLCKVDIINHNDVIDSIPFLKDKINIIYNFACPASPPIYQKIPIETLLTCTQGTANILKIAYEHNSIVVHASTSEVYGNPEISPQHELYHGNVNSYGPRACYDEGKRAAEALCFDYLNQLNTDVRLVRIFNTYGPHMDYRDGRVITNFIIQALERLPITIYGDGNQTRSFCYVDDLIDGIVRLANLDENPRTPINLGNPNEFTINELAEKIRQKLSGEFKYYSLPVDDPLQRKPDISLAQKILGWEPKIQLDEGLDKTIQYLIDVTRF
jgi:UDP-glucuronate decarboxylase